MSRYINRDHFWAVCLRGACAGFLAMAGMASGALAQQAITISMSEATGNPGGTVELAVELTPGLAEPAFLVLFLDYDPEALAPNDSYYEFIQTGFDGNPVSITSSVRPESALTDSGKVLSVEYPAEGRMVLIMGGVNQNTIGEGPLATVAFDVVSGAPGEAVPLVWADESSASDPSGLVSIPITFVDGSVLVGCDPADTPGGVEATQNLADRVDISWSPVATSGAEYRVYRSQADDPATATPLGTAWTSQTTFSDYSALPPGGNGLSGCCRAGDPAIVTYYYWVKARTATGCEGELSEPAVQGFRAAAKAAATTAGSDGFVLGLTLVGLALAALRRRHAV